MKKIAKFDLNTVKTEDIIFTHTSSRDYEMSRVYVIEKLDSFIVLEGSHCSCYGFEDTTWEAIEYTEKEIEKLAMHDDEKWKIFLKEYLNI